MMSGRTRAVAWVAFALMSAALLVRLGDHVLMDVDEPRFAETARVMYVSGDYVAPRFNDAPRFAKPALFYWLIAGAYRLCGVTEFAARLPSAVATIVTGLLIVFVGGAVFGRVVGMVGALVWMSLLHAAFFARLAMTDATLVCFMTGATLSLLAAVTADPGGGEGPPAPGGGWTAHQLRWYTASAAFLGLAFLTKGPVGLLIPLGVLFLHVLSTRRLGAELRAWGRAVLTLRGLVPLLVFVAIACPWYVAEYLRDGQRFVHAFFGYENVARAARGIDHRQGLLYLLYFPVMLLLIAFPWSCLLPGALCEAWRGRLVAKPLPEANGDSERRAPQRFLVWWIALVLVGFSFSQTKNPHYIASLYPAVALLVGLYGERRRAHPIGAALDWTEKTALVLLGVVGLLLTIGLPVAAGLIKWGGEEVDASFGPPLRALAVMCVVGTVAVLLTYWAPGGLPRRRSVALIAGLAFSWGFGFSAVLLVIPPVMQQGDSAVAALARAAQRYVPEGQHLIVYDLDSSNAVFYSHRRVIGVYEGVEEGPVLNSPAKLAAALKVEPPGAPLVILVRQDKVTQVAAAAAKLPGLGASPEVLAQRGRMALVRLRREAAGPTVTTVTAAGRPDG